jgi:2,3-diaminopropionate biosynthesis protein SbnA
MDLTRFTAQELQALISGIGNTPVVRLETQGDCGDRPLFLKLEGESPGGSVKDRTAAGLVDDLERRGVLSPESVIVESTSGNLGVALAFIARAKGYRFHAVLDPKASHATVRTIRALGASLELVEEADESGGYLLARLRRVHELCAEWPGAVWTNQYANPANPRAHFTGTGPEIVAQMEGKLDAVVVPVSTGGTLAGIARYLRATSPQTEVVAVDSRGSVALGGEPGPRLLTGIGAARHSEFLLDTSLCDRAVLVDDARAIAFCRFVAEHTGLALGGSSGAVLVGAATLLAEGRRGRIVCLCPDYADRYATTLYDDDWLERHGIELDDELLTPIRDVALSDPVPTAAAPVSALAP